MIGFWGLFPPSLLFYFTYGSKVKYFAHPPAFAVVWLFLSALEIGKAMLLVTLVISGSKFTDVRELITYLHVYHCGHIYMYK